MPLRLKNCPPEWVSFVKMASVSEDGFISDCEVRPFDEVRKGFTYFEEGDVLLAKITPCFENGKAAVAEDLPHRIGFGSTEFHVLRPGPMVNTRYLFYFVWNQSVRSSGRSQMAGAAGQKRLPSDFLAKLEIPLPTLDEQRRIAAVLDKADALRRQRQESLQLTEKLLQSVFLDMFGDPRENPKNWDVVPLGQLVADDDTINYGVVQPGNDYPGGVPLIRLGDLANPDPMMGATKRIDPGIDASYSRSRLVGGEVLVGCVGHTIGVACVAPMEWVGANIARAVARINVRREIPAEFILQQIRSPAIQHFFRGERRIVGQPTLNIKQIKEAPILLPPPELRDQFANFYRLAVNGHTDKRRSEALIEGLFSAIQQRAFRGELDLIRLHLSPEDEEPPVTPTPQTTIVEGRYTRPGCFIAPPDLEQQLLGMEKKLEGDKAEPLPWSEDFFKFRTLSQILQPPFSFAKIWSAVEQDFEQPSYETVKNKVFEYVASGVLKQEFSEEQKEIVFRPKP